MSSTQALERLVPSLQSPVCWADEDQTVLVCTAVSDVTHDVKNFVFEPEGDQVFEFDAGQFLTLMLDIDGTPVNRCYTISSPPTRPNRIAITVKRVVGGTVSNWVHDNIVPGSKVTAMAPLGAFTLHQPAGGEAPLPLRGQRDHPADVDAADALRPRVGRRRRLPAQRAHAERHRLPQRARGHRDAHAQPPRRARLRGRLPVGALGRHAGTPLADHAPHDRPRPARADHLQLRPGAVHGRRTPDPR